MTTVKVNTRLGYELTLTAAQYNTYRTLIRERGMAPRSFACDNSWHPKLVECRDRYYPGTACVEKWFDAHPGEDSVLVLTPMGTELSGDHR